MRVRPFGIALWWTVGLALTACEKPSSQSASDAASGAATVSSAAANPSAAAAAASAKNAEESAKEEAKETEEDLNVKDELEAQHRHHHRGLAGFVMMAVETLGIGPDQQASVDKIKKDFHTKMRPVREANATVLQLLGDGIAAGTIDKAKVDAAVAKAGTSSSAVPTATIQALDALHGALRQEQRVALVDKVDANWTVWKETNGSEQEDDTKPHGHLAFFAKEYGLTSEQVDKVRANLDASKDAKKTFDAAAADAYVTAFNTAFVAETFDAKKLPASGVDNSKIVSWGAERMARFYEAVAPVLTADQKTKVADKLHERAAELNSKDKEKEKEKP